MEKVEKNILSLFQLVDIYTTMLAAKGQPDKVAEFLNSFSKLYAAVAARFLALGVSRDKGTTVHDFHFLFLFPNLEGGERKLLDELIVCAGLVRAKKWNSPAAEKTLWDHFSSLQSKFNDGPFKKLTVEQLAVTDLIGVIFFAEVAS
jgi:hypothetical protein